MPGKNMNEIQNSDQFDSLNTNINAQQKTTRNTDQSRFKRPSKRYEDRTRTDLYQEAKRAGIDGRSKMSKYDLIHALRNN